MEQEPLKDHLPEGSEEGREAAHRALLEFLNLQDSSSRKDEESHDRTEAG